MMAAQDSGKNDRMYRAITRQIGVTVEPNFCRNARRPKTQFCFCLPSSLPKPGGDRAVAEPGTGSLPTPPAEAGSSPAKRGREQPVLAPAKLRISAAALPTASGLHDRPKKYQMVTREGEKFRSTCGVFAGHPDSKRVLN